MNPHRTAQANEAALRKVLTQRTLVALSKQNVAFVLEHQNDTWQGLSQYISPDVRPRWAAPPARTEVIGGDFIELRFGSWGKALASIGIRGGGRLSTPSVENTKLFRDEYERQRTADKRAKREKKAANKRTPAAGQGRKTRSQTSASARRRREGSEMAKRKIPLKAKGRRFRADLWLDEKITGRTLDVLRRQGVRFPENVNPRKTAAFKEEYQRQLAQFGKRARREKICKPGIPIE